MEIQWNSGLSFNFFCIPRWNHLNEILGVNFINMLRWIIDWEPQKKRKMNTCEYFSAFCEEKWDERKAS